MKQLSFSDMELSINRSKKTRSEIQLDKINRIVNWQDIAGLLSQTDKTGKQGGRKPISVLVKAKMLFVQYLYNLSDPELEDQLYDRLSFQGTYRSGCGQWSDPKKKFHFCPSP